jgi:hypothetical protein
LQKGHDSPDPANFAVLPSADRVIIDRQQRFAFFRLLEHTELTLSLTEKAGRKALAEARRLMNEDGLA